MSVKACVGNSIFGGEPAARDENWQPHTNELEQCVPFSLSFVHEQYQPPADRIRERRSLRASRSHTGGQERHEQNHHIGVGDENSISHWDLLGDGPDSTDRHPRLPMDRADDRA